MAFKLSTNVNHRCPACGKAKWNRIGPGWVQKTTHCQACGTDYTLTRDMHVPGLTGREVAKKKAGGVK